MLTSTDQRGVVHTYTYNSAGQQILDDVTNFGNLPPAAKGVQEIATAYTDLGQVQTVTSLDSNGNIVNQVEDAYDGWGNLTQEWQAVSGAVISGTPSVQWKYSDGYAPGTQGQPAPYLRMTDVIYPDGSDILLRLRQPAKRPGGLHHVAIVRDQRFRHFVQQYAGGLQLPGADTLATENYEIPQVKLDYSANNFAALDRFGRVLDQVWAGYGSGNSGTLDGYAYTYNGAGDRLTQAETYTSGGTLTNGPSQTFGYDSLDRLTSWTQTGPQTGSETWTLDSLGNDLSGGKTYDSANEEGSTSNYDLAGNMTTLASGDGAVYDAWDRLVAVTSGATPIESCQYDGLNRRIEVTASGTTTDDYYAGQQMVQSNVVGGGGYEYVWSPRYIDAPIVRSTLNSAQNGLATNPQIIYYLGDANYNVTALVNSSGTVVERYSYTPYGVVSYYTGSWGNITSSAYANTILFSGHQLDTATSLYYCRARFYDAALQRFISRDPAQADENLYRYCGDEPTNGIDPGGMMPAMGRQFPPDPAGPPAGTVFRARQGWESTCQVCFSPRPGLTTQCNQWMPHRRVQVACTPTSVFPTIRTRGTFGPTGTARRASSRRLWPQSRSLNQKSRCSTGWGSEGYATTTLG